MSGSGTTTVTDVRSTGGQSTYNLTVTGTYNNGMFTETSETYTEVDSSYYSETVIWTYPDGSTYQTDNSESLNYSVSWSAVADSEGQLNYAYYYASSVYIVHSDSYATYPYGGTSSTTSDSNSTTTATGSGTTATSTNSTSWSSSMDSYSPGGGNYSSGNSYSSQSSGTAPLGQSFGVPSIPWMAGTSDAINFSYYGVSTISFTLTEAASFGVTSSGFDVNSFNSTSHTLDSSHTVDDEPGVSDSGTGTTLFHRDEFYQDTNDVLGSGSYVGGGGYANYQSTENAQYVVNDIYTDSNDQSSGYDNDGNPYQLTFNYSDGISVSGSVTNTHSYFDDGTGLALTGESFSGGGSGQEVISSWGSYNGTSFSNPTSVIDQGWSSSVSLSGEPGVVSFADGVANAFPLQLPAIPVLASFMADPIFPTGWPLRTLPGAAGSVQGMYNQMINRIGGQALTKAANAFLTEIIMIQIQDNNPGGAFPKGFGQFTQEKGGTFAAAMGDTKQLKTSQENMVAAYTAARWTNATVTQTTVQISYVIDGANQNPRSGNVAVIYTYTSTITGMKDGVARTVDVQLFNRGVKLHDAKLEKMDLAP